MSREQYDPRIVAEKVHPPLVPFQLSDQVVLRQDGRAKIKDNVYESGNVAGHQWLEQKQPIFNCSSELKPWGSFTFLKESLKGQIKTSQCILYSI